MTRVSERFFTHEQEIVRGLIFFIRKDGREDVSSCPFLYPGRLLCEWCEWIRIFGCFEPFFRKDLTGF
jgi:hypothetical protein